MSSTFFEDLSAVTDAKEPEMLTKPKLSGIGDKLHKGCLLNGSAARSWKA